MGKKYEEMHELLNKAKRREVKIKNYLEMVVIEISKDILVPLSDFTGELNQVKKEKWKLLACFFNSFDELKEMHNIKIYDCFNSIARENFIERFSRNKFIEDIEDLILVEKQTFF